MSTHPRVAAVVATIALILAGCTSSSEPAPTSTQVSEPSGAAHGLSDATDVVQKVKTSVLVVNNYLLETNEAGEQVLAPQSTGSGVVVDSDGLIITNLHVVDGADAVTVVAIDGRPRRADIVALLGEQSDLALLQVEDSVGLDPVTMGESYERVVGSGTVVVGNPVGIGLSAATGILSAGGRVIQTEDAVLFDILQTDAAINPGNSGGALFDSQGRLLGINTAVRGDTEGIGFAIPVEQVTDFLDAVREDRPVPYIGIGIVTLDSELLELSDSPADKGAAVLGVSPVSPASAAGVATGDIIVAADGQPVASSSDVHLAVKARQPGDLLDLEIIRFVDGNDERIPLTITIGGLTPTVP
ncbi:MAG: S1C family serine protease [Acidimicrobiia bacterium]